MVSRGEAMARRRNRQESARAMMCSPSDGQEVFSLYAMSSNANACHDLGGDITYVNPLRLAMGEANTTLVQILLQAGSDVNDVHPKGDGMPPLSFASHRGYEAIVRLLLDA